MLLRPQHRFKKALSALRDPLRLSAGLVCAASLLLCLPALTVWLGLPSEDDAVDYRVPLVKWIASHWSIPNWSWTFIDDYPSLSEICMALLYQVSPNLMRLVPIAGYLIFGYFSGRIFSLVVSPRDRTQTNTAILVGAAWALTLRPTLIQSNLLMVDTLAAGLLLGAGLYLHEGKAKTAGLFGAMALATRYTVWAGVAMLPIAYLAIGPKKITARLRECVLFGAISLLGALPFLVRNWVLNQNPFFPIASRALNGITLFDFGSYGRGTSPIDLLLFPFDLIYTNTFVRGFYDYTIGKLFYIQLGSSLALVLIYRKKFSMATRALFANRLFWSFTAFSFLCFLAWFYSSQQLRFLPPSLALWTMGLLWIHWQLAPRAWICVVTLLGLMSLYSVQMNSVLIAFGRRSAHFEPNRAAATACFSRADLPPNSSIEHAERDGTLGFFNHSFYFGKNHPYFVPKSQQFEADFIYSPNSTSAPPKGYQPWPAASPCGYRKIVGSELSNDDA